MPRESSPGWVWNPILSLYIPASHITGTSQVIYLETMTLGYKFVVTALSFVQSIATVGANGAQTITVRKGTAAAGTAIVALAIAIANSGIGTVERAVTAVGDLDDAYFNSDADTMSIEMAASGTSFSAGEGTLTVWGRTRPQAAR